MKTINILAGTLLLSLGLASCLDNAFLDRAPIDKEIEETVFTNYDNFKMYSWSLYKEQIKGYNERPHQGDESDMMYWAQSPNGIALVTNRLTASNISTDMWSFKFVRNVNIMLDNIDKSPMTDVDKEHWRSVGYFFRAYAYFDLLKDFGDLPWLEHVVKTDDEETLYAKKDSRELIADHLLSNLLYAEEHIKPAGDGKNTINPNVIRAFISRFGLYEGTWRKYHGAVDGVDATKYLEASVKASQKLIDQNLGLVSDYDAVFNSPSLKNEKSILLYKEYVEYDNKKSHNLTNDTREYEYLMEGTKRLVEHYLCSDGKPISTSTQYQKDATIYDEFKNRDYRLYYTICPPYEVKTSSDRTTWEYTGKPEDRQFIDMMKTITGGVKGAKALPLQNGKNTYTGKSPNLEAVKTSGLPTRAGYLFYRYYNEYPGAENRENQGTDAPIFRMGEVLVNHAEAMYELGRFDQAIADITINKLRVRAHVTAMKVADITAGFDTWRDADVTPILWEIRRERCVELIGSGFRFDDIKRWKKGIYLSLQPVGVKINNIEDYHSEPLKNSLYDGADQPRYKNCVTYIDKPKPGWEDKCYLYPIPLKQTLLNTNLVQNPGWK
ncbi:MAG: RagB/SusD family nutrient uptake outer membrane protein [Tannerellaceae bacterium]